ncbi:MAG: PIN domain-containing protein [Paludibacteraceae bacterium]|nr:PIN domain-containing protein [Paludibacteraceae bacterium]
MLWLKEKITLLYNREILAEYTEVLSRVHFHISKSRLETLINYIYEHGIVTNRTTFNELLIDEDDRVFYEVSLSKDDSFLVTGNLKHFPFDPRVVTPAQMLQILGED